MKYLLVLLLFLSRTCLAQTISSINGNISDGQVITLNGSGFGNKPGPAPQLYSEFNETQAQAEHPIESLAGIHGWHSWGAATEDPAMYSNEALRDGTGFNARFIYPDRIIEQREDPSGAGLEDALIHEGLDINASDRVYLSIWIRSDFDGPKTSGEDPQQWKILRYSRGQNGYPALIHLWHGAPAAHTPPGSSKIFNYRGDGAQAEATLTPWDAPPPLNTWWHMEIEARVSSAPGVADGSVRAWYNGEERLFRNNWAWLAEAWTDAQGVSHPADDPQNVWNWLMIGQYIQRPPRRYTVRFDDVYHDKSWARVLLCDQPAFAACRHREPQPAIAWESSGITLTLNRGSFQPGATAYLMVIDSSGNSGPGYPVTIAADYPDDPIAPAAPQGLRSSN